VRLTFLYLLACAVVFCISCYGGGKSQERQTRAEQFGVRGGLVFIGVSGKLSNRDASIHAALEDAARRLSFFHSVSGYFIRRENIGGGVFDFDIGGDYRLEYDRELEKFMEELSFDPETDVFENNNAVFVVTRTAQGVSMPQFRGHSFGSERPLWIDAPPSEIGGFAVGIGFSSRQSYHRDTIVKSYENAVLSIIGRMSSKVTSRQESYDSSSAFGFASTTTSEISASGTLKNFYIIESWTDPANLSVWTLAVANIAGSAW